MYQQYIRVPSLDHIAWQQSYIASRLAELEAREPTFAYDLARIAAQHRRIAYTKVTAYKVGVAILTKSNQIYVGSNKESFTLTPSVHAEIAAITNAIDAEEIQRSGEDFLDALAVSHEKDTAPCGICRQVMLEMFSNPLIIVADTLGVIRGITSLQLLTFYSFSPSSMDDLT